MAEISVGEQGDTLSVKEEEVPSQLKRTNAGKTAGPDRVEQGLLKTCAEQFAPISVSF